MKRPKTASISKNNSKIKKQSQEKKKSDSTLEELLLNDPDQYITEKMQRKIKLSDYINFIFPEKLYKEIYYAWCKDLQPEDKKRLSEKEKKEKKKKDILEMPSFETVRYFREELLSRNNNDLHVFNFSSMHVGKNFLTALCNNLPSIQLKKVELQDNLITDECVNNLKVLITSKQLIQLNLASNQISTEGLKIIQNDLANTKHLKYLNLGVTEGSFRVNNFSGDGGIVLARIILKNKSIETLILQENFLGEDAGDKIGTALIENKTLKKLVISDNKIRNKGARSILENGVNLISVDLSNNDISPEVCYELKILIQYNKVLKEIIWSGNYVGIKGINFIVDSLAQKTKLKSLSLKNTSIGKKGIKLLSEGLTNNTFLEILDLGSNNIALNSFISLCDCLNTNRIKIFRCRNNLLGDDSMKYFADNILNKNSTSCLANFDFSSCKIYDQGLIYILNGLISNEKISWINLRDNCFSHDIDFVILDFLEKNTNLIHIDLTKNRFSFQCLQKVNKIVKRNRIIQNNKEPNKLLVELYSLKYENTKLNELRETLKNLENYNAKLKLNKLDLRQDYEIFRKENNEKISKKKKLIEEKTKEYNNKLIELDKKKKELIKRKEEHAKRLKEFQYKYDKLLKEKTEAIEINEKIKKDIIDAQEEWKKKNEELDSNIEKDEKTRDELKKKLNEIEFRVEKAEDQIKEFEKNNPELVQTIRDEEKKILEEEEYKKNKVIFNLNKKIEKNDEIKEEKKDQNKIEIQEDTEIKDNKKTNKKYNKKKTKKIG